MTGSVRHGGRANRRRGEVEAMLDGERRILCLTLGALAELETAFAVGDLSGLAQRFSSGRLKAGDMICLIGAGLRGGGNLLSDEEVAAMSIDGGVAGYARIIGELLEATFGAEAEEAAGGVTSPTTSGVAKGGSTAAGRTMSGGAGREGAAFPATETAVAANP